MTLLGHSTAAQSEALGTQREDMENAIIDLDCDQYLLPDLLYDSREADVLLRSSRIRSRQTQQQNKHGSMEVRCFL